MMGCPDGFRPTRPEDGFVEDGCVPETPTFDWRLSPEFAFEATISSESGGL